MKNTPTYHSQITQTSVLLYAIQRMDIESINALLSDKYIYQKMSKALFLQKLEDVFTRFKNYGDTFLYPFAGSCNEQSCNYQCKGVCFIGNHTKNYFTLIIDVQNGIITDLYECGGFKTYRKNLERNNRIFICEPEVGDLPF